MAKKPPPPEITVEQGIAYRHGYWSMLGLVGGVWANKGIHADIRDKLRFAQLRIEREVSRALRPEEQERLIQAELMFPE